MRIWVDADSCPRPVREIVARAAERRAIDALFVANRALPDELPERVSLVCVERGEGKADDYIRSNGAPGDLAITRDIPLAASLVERGLAVVNDRGDLYTRENVRERLSIRDFMYELRNNGLVSDRDSRYGRQEAKRFADALDRELTRLASPRPRS